MRADVQEEGQPSLHVRPIDWPYARDVFIAAKRVQALNKQTDGASFLNRGCGMPSAKSVLYVDWPNLAIGGDGGEDYLLNGTGPPDRFAATYTR